MGHSRPACLTCKMKGSLLVLPVLALICIGLAQGFNWCSLGRDHTMCKYKGVGPRCPKLISRGVTSAMRKAILNRHNQLRRMVAMGWQRGQPPAANMRQLVWNPELANIAQRWADQCHPGHDRNRRMKDKSYVGQNYAMSGTTARLNPSMLTKGAENGVQRWYNEVKSFPPSSIQPFRFVYSAGHYSQVVWANSYQIGCGFVAYKAGGFNRMITICNYAPGGNMRGRTMYIKGQACSACPRGTKCRNGLCA